MDQRPLLAAVPATAYYIVLHVLVTGTVGMLLGAWLIISPAILDQKYPIAHPMYWSNSWSGGVLMALALAGLATVVSRPARRTRQRNGLVPCADARSKTTRKEHVMSLSYRQQHQLRLIEAGLLRSDPQLAGMMGVFGGLAAGQGMPAWERVLSRRERIGQAAALLREAATVVAAAISLLLSAVLTLLTATVNGGRVRLPAPQHGRARRPVSKHERADPGQGAAGRSDPADRA